MSKSLLEELLGIVAADKRQAAQILMQLGDATGSGSRNSSLPSHQKGDVAST